MHGPRSNESESCRVALTFDDGPHPVHTPRLLDELAAAELTATFFVVGEKAAAHPQLIRRIVAEGHELGNHTWTHGEPVATSTSQFLEEIRRTGEFLADLTGETIRLMRPPKGQLTFGKLLGVLREGLTVVLWNVDSRDYAMIDSAKTTAWCDQFVPEDGDVVLMHDNHEYAATIIGQLRRKRFESVKISRWTHAQQSGAHHDLDSPSVHSTGTPV